MKPHHESETNPHHGRPVPTDQNPEHYNSEPRAGVAASLRRGPAGHGAITILLVDDDPDCRMLIRDAITESKVSNAVFEVADGKDALDFLQRRGEWAHAPRPGLIYMDIEMPGMNGLDALRAIKAEPDLRDIPVVMMTGVSEEKQMRLAAELGANSYTIKPANSQQFLQTVMLSTSYWLTIHQYPNHHLPADQCRR